MPEKKLKFNDTNKYLLNVRYIKDVRIECLHSM